MESARDVSAHREMIQSEDFSRSIDFALMEFQRLVSQTPLDNFNAAAAAHFRITGAQEFIHVLRNLSETPKITPIKSDGNLDHRA